MISQALAQAIRRDDWPTANLLIGAQPALLPVVLQAAEPGSSCSAGAVRCASLLLQQTEATGAHIFQPANSSASVARPAVPAPLVADCADRQVSCACY